MKPSTDLIRQLPDLDTLFERLEEDPARLVTRAFPAEDERPVRALAGPAARSFAVELPGMEETLVAERRHLVQAGTRAIGKIRKDGADADLDPEEAVGLEAIVLIEGRPAILVQDGRFFPPPVKWQILEQMRAPIEQNCRSVGRIEVQGHPSYDWIGTGFLVGKDVIMTNRHVAREFCRMGARRRWGFEPGIQARIDYVEEFGALDSAEFAIKKVIGIHELFDLALLQVERKSTQGMPAPEPLSISTRPPSNREAHGVYTVGYPAWDGRRNDPEIMRKIFSNIFDVKRLQPGEVTQLLDTDCLFIHDCSTLGGNSGSCVIDLETNQVLGLHFGGRYLQGNHAVALWQLTDDPLLKKGKVNFV